MEPLVIHPVMEIWMKTILAWMEAAKMDLASFMVDTRDVHQEETHLLQVCHF
jgi:tryptophan 2,3-dioxygenase